MAGVCQDVNGETSVAACRLRRTRTPPSGVLERGIFFAEGIRSLNRCLLLLATIFPNWLIRALMAALTNSVPLPQQMLCGSTTEDLTAFA
jgi:hypothetical protein